MPAIMSAPMVFCSLQDIPIYLFVSDRSHGYVGAIYIFLPGASYDANWLGLGVMIYDNNMELTDTEEVLS